MLIFGLKMDKNPPLSPFKKGGDKSGYRAFCFAPLTEGAEKLGSCASCFALKPKVQRNWDHVLPEALQAKGTEEIRRDFPPPFVKGVGAESGGGIFKR
jgi:hypothetical protein